MPKLTEADVRRVAAAVCALDKLRGTKTWGGDPERLVRYWMTRRYNDQLWSRLSWQMACTEIGETDDPHI